jgi:hypothetical protein
MFSQSNSQIFTSGKQFLRIYQSTGMSSDDQFPVLAGFSGGGNVNFTVMRVRNMTGKEK